MLFVKVCSYCVERAALVCQQSYEMGSLLKEKPVTRQSELVDSKLIPSRETTAHDRRREKAGLNQVSFEVEREQAHLGCHSEMNANR